MQNAEWLIEAKAMYEDVMNWLKTTGIEQLAWQQVDGVVRQNEASDENIVGSTVPSLYQHKFPSMKESSLRCALEEALLLQRTFVMPSRMCMNPIHSKKVILPQSDNASSEERWAANSCSVDSLYDLDLIADTVPVIVDNSKMWYQVLLTNMELGNRGVAHVEGVDRVDLKESNFYSNLLLFMVKGLLGDYDAIHVR
ncbi:hypothetical protein MRB53_026619 [Persea americana]|uniref:Uncharacterized protein n=1 Tax=Persea americana TaxID=3435 RepID=A0ACC2LJH0_PERAE|nr:hypothetical protein MRB53_026619 [Persea americana]